MKKIMSTLSILTFLTSCNAAFAYSIEGTSADMETLHKQGYSTSTMMVVDTARSLSLGDSDVYEARYQHKDANKPKLVQWYNKVKYYVDPASDDGNFFRREIVYDNRFYDLDPVKNTKNDPLAPNL